jgi:hypothetical protein
MTTSFISTTIVPTSLSNMYAAIQRRGLTEFECYYDERNGKMYMNAPSISTIDCLHDIVDDIIGEKIVFDMVYFIRKPRGDHPYGFFVVKNNDGLYTIRYTGL